MAACVLLLFMASAPHQEPKDGKPELASSLVGIVTVLHQAGQAMPHATVESLNQAVRALDEQAMVEAVAEMVFLEVTINPEGRVRVSRGRFVPGLKKGRPLLALVKVNNQSFGQQRLHVRCACPGTDTQPLEATMHDGGTTGKDLRGHLVEYRLVKLTCSRAGLLEAQFSFQAGQGTEDLGFRGEAPVLFRVSD